MIVTLSNCCETEICILTRTELETQLTAARFTLEAVWSYEKRWLCGTPPWMSSQELRSDLVATRIIANILLSFVLFLSSSAT